MRSIVFALLVFLFGAICSAQLPPVNEVIQDSTVASTGNHRTTIEPDSFSYGLHLGFVTQCGRSYTGGASGTCYAFSSDGGVTFPSKGQMPYPPNQPSIIRMTDSTIFWDNKRSLWVVSWLSLVATTGCNVDGAAMWVSTTGDNGATWTHTIVPGSNTLSPDKNWLVGDNNPSSPGYGNYYATWDYHGNSNQIAFNTYHDIGGGVFGWYSAAKTTSPNPVFGLGGQLVVQPNGNVIVPYLATCSLGRSCVAVVRSTDRGSTWAVTSSAISVVRWKAISNLRASALPSAEVDVNGLVYISWADCSLRSTCTGNDIVYTTTTNGSSFAAIKAVPLPTTASNKKLSYYAQGFGVDATSSSNLAVTYYYVTNAACTNNVTCQFKVGLAKSTNTGSTWTYSDYSNAFSMGLLPLTSQGYMFGDYMSTSWSNGTPFGTFVIAGTPSQCGYNVALYTTLAPTATPFSSTLGPCTNTIAPSCGSAGTGFLASGSVDSSSHLSGSLTAADVLARADYLANGVISDSASVALPTSAEAAAALWSAATMATVATSAHAAAQHSADNAAAAASAAASAAAASGSSPAQAAAAAAQAAADSAAAFASASLAAANSASAPNIEDGDAAWFAFHASNNAALATLATADAGSAANDAAAASAGSAASNAASAAAAALSAAELDSSTASMSVASANSALSFAEDAIDPIVETDSSALLTPSLVVLLLLALLSLLSA